MKTVVSTSHIYFHFYFNDNIFNFAHLRAITITKASMPFISMERLLENDYLAIPSERKPNISVFSIEKETLIPPRSI